MDEKRQEQIDRYLRKEMSAEESLLFEQEALNDKCLRDEVELTYRIRRRLADRQRKLRQTVEWERKHHWYTNPTMFMAGGIAAAVALMVVVIAHSQFNVEDADVPLLAENTQSETRVEQQPEQRPLLAANEVGRIKKSYDDGKSRDVVESVSQLEQIHALPSLYDVGQNTLMASQTATHPTDESMLSSEAYELYWMKICSMTKIGETDSAMASLNVFMTIDGKYKQKADSLLRELQTKQ